MIASVLHDCILCCEALVESHLRSFSTKKVMSVTSQKVTVSRSWKSAQELASHFWNRFLREYIPNQQTRSKWNKTSENLKVNDLVWLLEDFTPRGLWPRAKVIEIYPGSDGVVRSVKLRTPHGEKVRPVIKLSKVLINK